MMSPNKTNKFLFMKTTSWNKFRNISLEKCSISNGFLTQVHSFNSINSSEILGQFCFAWKKYIGDYFIISKHISWVSMLPITCIEWSCEMMKLRYVECPPTLMFELVTKLYDNAVVLENFTFLLNLEDIVSIVLFAGFTCLAHSSRDIANKICC